MKKKSIQFIATLGILPGYGHKNKTRTQTAALKIAGKAWQEAGEEVLAETGSHVGGVITPSLTVYNKQWGCPTGGETSVVIMGVCNPNYEIVANYKKAVRKTLEKAAKKLKQHTTQLTFQEVDFEYFDFRKKEKK